jgi:hypothetical protein
MKKIILFITALSLVFLLLTASLHATPQASVVQNTHNFGSVPEGTVIKHNFIIHNNGDEILRIKNIKTG